MIASTLFENVLLRFKLVEPKFQKVCVSNFDCFNLNWLIFRNLVLTDHFEIQFFMFPIFYVSTSLKKIFLNIPSIASRYCYDDFNNFKGSLPQILKGLFSISSAFTKFQIQFFFVFEQVCLNMHLSDMILSVRIFFCFITLPV